MLVTSTETEGLTVIEQVFETPHSSLARQVIVAVPAPLAVTKPLLLTDATLLLLLDQLTLLSVALLGETVAVNCLLSPTFSEADEVFRVMLDTQTVELTTVM